MQFMEGNRQSASPPPPADISSEDELNRSNSDASTLTVENCKDILHRSANVKPEMNTKWTDEKHSLYLEHLEVSFVKQLQQSIGLLPQYSNYNKRVNGSAVMRRINVDNASEKFTTVPHGCQEEINCNRVDPLSHVSPDSLKSQWVRSKRIRMHTPAGSAYMPGRLMLCDTENHGKVVTSCGLDTCSQQCSDSSRYHGDSHSITKEGTGQNFVDEGPYTEPRVKRLKTAL
ncbi:hypothetical protein ACS0TY_001822 [Phlomoides rotata]